jgi:hypothetical protein
LVAAMMRTSTVIGVFPLTPAELARLEHAQQIELQLGTDVADLVEEQRAPSAVSNVPRRRPAAPVNAPFSWPNWCPLRIVTCVRSRMLSGSCVLPSPRDRTLHHPLMRSVE